MFFGENKVRQDASINSPILNNIFSISETSVINHLSDDKSTLYGGKSTMLVHNGKLKTDLELGYESLKEQRENLFITSEENLSIDSLQNNLKFTQQKIQLKVNSKYSLSKKVEVSFGISLDYIDIFTNDSEHTEWLLNPRIGLRLQNLKIGYFSLNFSRNYNEPKSNLFLNNYQLNSYQSLIKGQNSVYLPRNNIFGFFYQINNDLQTKTLSIRTQYISSDGKYSTQNQIGQDFILTNYNFVKTGDLLFSNIDFTSYFKKLNLSTNLGSSQSFSNIPIRANTPDFRNLKIYSSSYTFSGKTYFKLPLNFNFKLKYNQSKAIFNDIQSKTSWKNIDLNTTYKITDIWIASLNNNFYITDSNYYFIDFKLNYNPKKSRFSYELVLNNITNENQFSIIDVAEYSTYSSNIQLIPRYLYIWVKYRF